MVTLNDPTPPIPPLPTPSAADNNLFDSHGAVIVLTGLLIVFFASTVYLGLRHADAKLLDWAMTLTGGDATALYVALRTQPTNGAK